MTQQQTTGIMVLMAGMAERARMAELVGDRLGLALADVRPADGGQGRTCYASLAGTPVVVKWGLDPDLPEKIPYVAGQVPELRRRDIPVPRILAHAPLGGQPGGYGWVLERLPGAPGTVLDEALLGDLVELIARMAAAPPGPHRNDMGYWAPAVVFEDMAGWWRTAEAMGPEAAGFCRRLRAWAGQAPPPPVARPGYVHVDLGLGNVLVAGGRLAGVIDIETSASATGASTWPGSPSNGTCSPGPRHRGSPPTGPSASPRWGARSVARPPGGWPLPTN